MLLNVLDGDGNAQVVVVAGQESATDASGTLASGAAHVLLAANTDRSGWFIQNQSAANPMAVNDLGVAASLVSGGGSFIIGPGETFPPAGYPLSTAAINIIGTAGDGFFVREW